MNAYRKQADQPADAPAKVKKQMSKRTKVALVVAGNCALWLAMGAVSDSIAVKGPTALGFAMVCTGFAVAAFSVWLCIEMVSS